MEVIDQIKEQAMFYIEHSGEYLEKYVDFFTTNILDISKSFYPDDPFSQKTKTRIILIDTIGSLFLVIILLNIIFSVISKLFFSSSSSSKNSSAEKINKKYKDSCLILGEPAAGKTLLFSRLVFGPEEDVTVHTSTAPNSGVWIHDPRKKRGVGIIDAPGNKKVAGCWREIVKSGSRDGVAAPSAIVFVIDSTSFEEKKTVVTE